MFDLVTAGDEEFFGLAHGVFDGPVANFHRHFGGELFAADVDDEVEAGHGDVFEIFREMVFEANILFFHDFLREGLDDGSRGEAGARGLDYIGTIFAGESFRHLATNGVTDAKKENFFHAFSV